ncbi:hypothetical protein FRB90_007260 [Tulasnella sp. 427]|nr:hypothetical protein FRB90_007260 [Tulasnella sp. 427]
MARDKTDQSALTPARNTRSQRRLASQDERASTSGDETSFDMKITSDTYLLDLNESFAAHMMAGNSTTAGDATFAVPQSPKRRTKGRRTPSPAKARSEELYIPSDDVIADEQPSAKALDVSPTLPTSATQSTTVPPAKVSAAKSATSSSQVFPSTGNDAAASSSNPSTTEAESGGKSAPRRKSLIARPVPAKNALSASTTAPSNAWLSRKPSRPTLPTPSTSSSPASGELITSASETPAPEPSVQPTPSEAGLIPTASEPAAPAFRKIVKLKRTGLTRVSRSSAGNSAVSDSQSSSNDLSTPPPVPAPTTSVEQKPANKPSPPPTSEKAPTVPHAFTFQSDRRLDLKKAVQEIKQKPSTKVVLQTFKPAHHPATLDKPTAASLSRALATVSQSENQPPTAGKAPSKKTSTLATHAKFQPTVPQAPKFALDERMKERSVFDEVLRQKEEERQKAEEAELEAEERRKEQEVKELRKLLDETARANVHPVPEWYKERPKLKKEADGAGVPS